MVSDIKDAVISFQKHGPQTEKEKETEMDLNKIALLEKKLQKEYMKKIFSKTRSGGY